MNITLKNKFYCKIPDCGKLINGLFICRNIFYFSGAAPNSGT